MYFKPLIQKINVILYKYIILHFVDWTVGYSYIDVDFWLLQDAFDY